jgi:nitrogen fixation NifU-like protein
MMTAELKGKSEAEAKELFENVHNMLTGHFNGDEPEGPKRLGKLAILSGVSKFPARVKCASLAWHTVNSALKAEQEVVSTE